jgi:hypothetical protein
MNTSPADLAAKIAAQATENPAMYGRIDFSATPERFAAAPDDKTDIAPAFAARRPELLANAERVALVKAYTMIGDHVADPYAALMPTYGYKRLVAMLKDACDKGVDNVPDAPHELVRFIREMERLPSWLNRELIAEGARVERNPYANRAPFVIRGGLIGTFMNKYSALPMAITGTLSNQTAGRRAKETATFFTTTVMPGALDRHGAGFKGAAMVRFMHAMVRFNALRRDQWDSKIYGIPIPQVDQMPAGLISIFLVAQKVLRAGRTAFTPAERARLEVARYRCFLLGLPEELLADTPQGVVDILLTRHATLRSGFDETCRALVSATMAADLSSDRSLTSRFDAWLERGFGKLYFVNNMMHGNKAKAADVGVRLGLADHVSAAAATVVITATMAAYTTAARVPFLRGAADRSLVRKLERRLASYGHAEFTTNAESYRPVRA